MNQYRLVVAVVSETFEEYSAAQEGDLQCLDVYIDAVFVPCPRTNSVGNKGCKDSVEVEKKE